MTANADDWDLIVNARNKSFYTYKTNKCAHQNMVNIAIQWGSSPPKTVAPPYK